MNKKEKMYMWLENIGKSNNVKLELEDIELLYKKSLEYDNEVKEFLLFIAGTHSYNEKDTWVTNSKNKIPYLRDERSKILECFGVALHEYEEDRKDLSALEPKRLIFSIGYSSTINIIFSLIFSIVIINLLSNFILHIIILTLYPK